MLLPVLTLALAPWTPPVEVAASAAVQVAASPAGQAPQEAASTRVEAILGAEESGTTKLGELVALGPGAVPELFDAVCRRVDRQPVPEDLPLLLSALVRMNRSAVMGELNVAKRAPELERRLGVLKAVEVLGGRDALGLAVAAASPAGPDERPEPRLIDAFERTALALLEGSGTLLGELPWLVREAPLEVSGALVRATAELGGGEALRALVRLLGRTPELDATILGHLGRAGRDVLPPLPAELVPPLRAALSSPDPMVARAALQAAGQLEVAAVTGECIELIESPSEPVAAGSLWALERITRLHLPGSASRWRLWYEGERAWLGSEAEGVFSRLGAGTPDVQRRAVELVMQHHVDRHRLALELTELLDSPSADLRLLAVSSLRSIGSKAAVPALVASLSDDDEAVAELALRTLRELTGRDHAADAPEWLELLGRT